MDKVNLRSEYEKMLPNFKRLEEEALFILGPALNETDIKIHSITSRVKTVDSFIDKAQRMEYSQPFSQIHDAVGIRVVCLFLSDIPRIGEIVRKCFLVLSEDNKIEDYDISAFGYLSVHFVVKMKKEYSGPRYDQIADTPFEIQVRTIAMHSWATISHYLDYKSEMDVPKPLRRDFYALSGLFYVADTHFEMFFKLSQKSREKLTKAFEGVSPKLDQEIDLDSMMAYLRRKFQDRLHYAPKYVSELIGEMAELGYTNISDIDRAIQTAWDAFLLWEKEDPPGDPKKSGKYSDVGVVRTVLKLLSEEYCSKHKYSDPPLKYKKMLKT